MTDEEREKLIKILREEFYEIGEPELADLADYTIETEEGRFRAEPRKRLFKMLEALESLVALEDASTLKHALVQIAEATNGEVPDVLVLPTRDENSDAADPLDFELYDQSDIRAGIRDLADLVLGDEGPSYPGARDR